MADEKNVNKNGRPKDWAARKENNEIELKGKNKG